jgi:ADP-ribose pyrophosphatase
MNLEIAAWQRQRSRVVADCRIFTVNESTSLSPITQQAHQFYFLDTADWVNVVPITADNEVVLVRQFRHGSERITLEIPGGMVDPGELPAAAAARECLEETGYVVHSGAAIDNQSTEHTEVQLVPLSQIPELLLSGEIDHALVVATLWRALYHLGGE